MRRKPDFITFPGTGMWMMCTPIAAAGLYLYRSLPVHTIQGTVEQGTYNLYWIDQGIGAHTLLNVRNGGKSSCATKVTRALLKRYLKEK